MFITNYSTVVMCGMILPQCCFQLRAFLLSGPVPNSTLFLHAIQKSSFLDRCPCVRPPAPVQFNALLLVQSFVCKLMHEATMSLIIRMQDTRKTPVFLRFSYDAVADTQRKRCRFFISTMCFLASIAQENEGQCDRLFGCIRMIGLAGRGDGV